MIIDPTNITNFQRSVAQLQLFLLFAVAVAGHNSKATARGLYRFLQNGFGLTPFQKIKWMLKRGTLLDALIDARLGTYNQLAKSYAELVDAKLDLRTATPQQLEKVFGIGPKTSRFFILHSRPNQQYAVLDTHILRWLRDQGFAAPLNTPQNSTAYAKWERVFLDQAAKLGQNPAQLDMAIWNLYSK